MEGATIHAPKKIPEIMKYEGAFNQGENIITEALRHEEESEGRNHA